jgi:hypothetical protein
MVPSSSALAICVPTSSALCELKVHSAAQIPGNVEPFIMT